jgi:hypothetical protein
MDSQGGDSGNDFEGWDVNKVGTCGSVDNDGSVVSESSDGEDYAGV